MSYIFDEKTSTPLCEIMGRNKSDKGHALNETCKHNYTTVYHSIFKDIRDKELRVFELGLGTNNIYMPSSMGPDGRPGASVYGWSEYFDKSKIYGADIDKDILFNTDRIKTYYCDQTNPNIISSMWEEPELCEPFDIIVEDGLHEFWANVCFFENSIHKLAKNGYFIIEDVVEPEIELFNTKIQEWQTKFPDLSFALIKIPCAINSYDNNLIVIHKSK